MCVHDQVNHWKSERVVNHLQSTEGTEQYLLVPWGRCKMPWGGHFFIHLAFAIVRFFSRITVTSTSWVKFVHSKGIP